MELAEDGSCRLQEPDVLGNLSPAAAPERLPSVAALPEATAWLNEYALAPFIDEVRAERLAEVERIWLYVVTDCASTPVLQQPVRDPAKRPWREVTKVARCYLSVDALKRPMEVREREGRYGERGEP